MDWCPEFAKLVMSADGEYRDYMEGIRVREKLRDAMKEAIAYVGEERGTPAERELLRDARANLDGARCSLAAAESALTSPEHAEKVPAAERIARFKEAKLDVEGCEAHLGEVEAAFAHKAPLGLGWFVRDKIEPLTKHYFLDGWDKKQAEESLKVSGLFKAALQRFVYRFDTKNALGLPPRKDGSARFFTHEELALVWLLAGGDWPEVRQWPANGLSVAEYLRKTTDAIRKHLDPENPFAPAPSRPRPGKEVRRGPDTSE